jgi:GT2 family glycosyltransferase
VGSLLEQTYPEREVIVVVDGNSELYEKFLSDYRGNGTVRAIMVRENRGVSEARNAGIREAGGDILAFMDDDAVADRKWLENLAATYETHDAVAVAGKILPAWTGGKPDYLPEELYWLIGVTHAGFAGDKVTEVRNAFGPNMSFSRKVFETIGTFNRSLGFSKRNAGYFQAEEAELALRMTRAFGKSVIYNPRAIVYHKVPPEKLRVRVLLRRAFYQGYSKALLRKLSASSGSLAAEQTYLKALVLHYIPGRLKRAYRPAELYKASMLIATVICVGMGFVYGGIHKGFPVEAQNSPVSKTKVRPL